MTAVTNAGIAIQTSGIHHVSLRTTDLARARVFYIDRLGFPVLMEQPGLVIFAAGGTAIALDAPGPDTAPNDRFNPMRVGLDHLALACHDANELRRVAAALTAAGVENTGVKRDPTLDKDYVAFKDPDGIAWELYMA